MLINISTFISSFVKVSRKFYIRYLDTCSLSGKILKSSITDIIIKGGVSRGRRDQRQSEACPGDREPHPGGPGLRLHLRRQEQGRPDEEGDPRRQWVFSFYKSPSLCADWLRIRKSECRNLVSVKLDLYLISERIFESFYISQAIRTLCQKLPIWKKQKLARKRSSRSL